jgi:HD-GYP domain-containing protein (c-di-GMP phosphodiesterase class II)
MDRLRINVSDVTVGKPLPWNVHDAAGNLLLNKGYIVESDGQLEALVARGMFTDADNLRRGQNSEGPKKEKPSTLRLINLANKRLERLLISMLKKDTVQPDSPANILEIAQAILFATELNPDVALACILLNQVAGNYPVRHCIDTAIISILIARAMNKSREETLQIIAAALTMNVGMLSHHQRLQSKQEGLTENEKKIIHQHPQISVAILRHAGVTDENWLAYVLYHHENEDGSGYPFGKKDTEIPQNAKLISLADRYSARVSARDYRKSVLPNGALREIFMEGGKATDAILAAYFVKELGIYPPGTFVRLVNEEIGVVTQKGEGAATPIVHSLVGAQGMPLATAFRRDTSKTTYAIKEALNEKQANVRFSMQQLWGEVASL